MPNIAKGSCLCGAVTFATASTFAKAYFCSCAQCRKITGTAFAANLFAAPATFEWLSGEEHIHRFDHSSRGFSKAFCGKCGCGVPYMNRDGTLVVVPAGALDNEPQIEQADRIFWNDRAIWSDQVAHTPHHAGFPA